MTLKILNTTVTVIMSLISLTVFLILILLSTAKTNIMKEQPTSLPSVQKLKEFVTNMIKDQSYKIQTLLQKIQTNAQSVLKKIDNIKQETKSKESKYLTTAYPLSVFKSQYEERQVESPILKKSIDTSDNEVVESRNFNNHFGTSSYGVSGAASYGGHTQTYHHHSIGFDPINIVVSMSLLSFLLQALQGLLSRTRLPTQVIEARYFNPVQDWLKKLEEKYTVSSKLDYLKRKYPKKYYS